MLKLSISLFLIFFYNVFAFSQKEKIYFIKDSDTITNYEIQFSDKSLLIPDLDGSVNKTEIDFSLQPKILYSFYEEVLNESKIFGNKYQLNAELQNETIFIKNKKKESFDINTKGLSILKLEAIGDVFFLVKIDKLDFTDIKSVSVKLSKAFKGPGWGLRNESKGKNVNLILLELDSSSIETIADKIIANKEQTINFEGNGWLKFDLSKNDIYKPNSKYLGIIFSSQSRVTYKTSPAEANSEHIFKMEPIYKTENFKTKIIGWKKSDNLNDQLIKFKITLEK